MNTKFFVARFHYILYSNLIFSPTVV
uniref:Uncharacterized protein n=1 Tax=Rhizophora mucronata TaxID=61149 RepID=A0A2P2IP29_RHIMU